MRAPDALWELPASPIARYTGFAGTTPGTAPQPSICRGSQAHTLLLTQWGHLEELLLGWKRQGIKLR